MKEEWIETKTQKPTEDTAYLCVKDREIKILVFNQYFQCWDQEDGDDFECKIEDVSHWMPLPNLPKHN